MNAATSKQKAYIRDLFVKCGVPKWVFNPIMAWKVSKQGADTLISDLLVLKKSNHGDLKEMICQTLEGKDILRPPTKTISQRACSSASARSTCAVHSVHRQRFMSSAVVPWPGRSGPETVHPRSWR